MLNNILCMLTLYASLLSSTDLSERTSCLLCMMCVSDEYIMLHFSFFFLLKGKWMLIALCISIHFPLSESVSTLFFLLPAKWIQEHFNWIGEERGGINDTTQLNQHQQRALHLFVFLLEPWLPKRLLNCKSVVFIFTGILCNSLIVSNQPYMAIKKNPSPNGCCNLEFTFCVLFRSYLKQITDH